MFIFTLLYEASKGSMKTFQGLHKTFRGITKKRPVSGRERLSLFKINKKNQISDNGRWS